MQLSAKLFIFIAAYLVAFSAAECVAATNAEPQGSIGITVRTLRVLDGNARVEWAVVLTNCEAHLILVSDAAVVKLLAGTKLTDAQGKVWHVRSTEGNKPPTLTQRDEYMFIRANKSFENVIETRGLESQSNQSKGLRAQPDSLEYRFDTAIAITDPAAKKDLVYHCMGTGKASVEWAGQDKGK